MKKVVVIAVGKIKEDFIKEGVEHYAKRLSRFCDFCVREAEESKREDIGEESRALLKLMEDGYNIVCDLNAPLVSSVELATIIDRAYLVNSRVNFIIGGSRGVNDGVRAKADAAISLGRVTFPHQLFRLLLSEQIYRAFTINESLPYHK